MDATLTAPGFAVSAASDSSDEIPMDSALENQLS